MRAPSIVRAVVRALKLRLGAYPCVRQHDYNDCGPATLATVARHHGVTVGLGRLRELCRSDASGTSLLGLAAGAEALGFTAKPAKAPYDALARCPVPFIAHVEDELPGLTGRFGHYDVVFEVDAKGVVVSDPARGPRWLSRADFERIWTGRLLLLVPTPRLSEVPPAGPAWHRFAALLSGRGSLILESMLAAVLFAALGIGTSFYVQHLVDEVLVRGNAALLHVASAGALLLVAFRVGFYALERYLLVHLSQKIDVALTMGYYQHVLRLPVSFFESRRTGEILTRLADAQKIRQVLSGTILSSIVDAFFILASGALMLAYDARLAAITLGIVPCFLLIVLGHRGAIRREQRRALEQGAALQSHLVEVVSGAAAVKAASAERDVSQRTETRLVALVRSTFRLTMLALSTDALSMFVTSAGSIAVMWYGGSLVLEGEMTIGRLLFFQSLLAHLLEPLSRLAGANVELENALVAADRVGEIFALAPEQPHGVKRLEPRACEGHVLIEDVHFRYGFREWTLQGVTIDARPGQTIALIGRSGSGKTTIAKLAARFFEPTRGRILLDGHDLRDLDLPWFRARVGVVDQECVVFSTTIAENIRLGRPTATFEEVVKAARRAGAHEFIEQLPERYDTIVGERGCNLSGGQRQRLAIARALLGDPPILILDEATSHLDSETERAVQETLREATRGRTTIVIAHRLSTVIHADRIYFLDKGRVIEEGTHQELLELGGAYVRAWLDQMPPGFDEESEDDPVVILDEPVEQGGA